ncbi:MAG: thioesterase family protein [Tomitella sp.]|nr:thioesterase family protein [Tomitella sp.]
MTAERPFAELMRLTPTGDCTYEASIDRHWSIGPKVHGGVMLALCAEAASAAVAEGFAKRDGAGDPGGSPGEGPAPRPMVVSADFLSAPDPGVVVLRVTPRKLGRRVSLADVELSQGERTAVRAVVTIAALDDKAPLHATVPGLASLPPVPTADAIDVSTHPAGKMINLAKRCEVRWDPKSAGFLDSQARDEDDDAPLRMRLWVRPKGEDPGVLFALMSGDVSAPVTLHLGRFGWAPTIQLTTYLRGDPAPGWLRVESSSTLVGSTWFEEDHVVLDESGNVVVQSRQLAMVPDA